MKVRFLCFGFVCLVSSALVSPVFGQEFSCKKDALAALRPLPKLKYKCVGDESDAQVLSDRGRIRALVIFAKSLEKLTFADWWKSPVDDLNACLVRGKAGKLNEEERSKLEYADLFGNSQLRVIRVADPCYQTQYGGSNIFLLKRKGGKVFASELIDGYFSRADAIFVDFAANKAGQIIEIATSTGGLNPTATNYYFTLNPKTNRAVPKNLFRDENGKPTNRITSEMLLENSEEYGLPAKSPDPLLIVENGRLVESFAVYSDTYETFGADNHKKFKQRILRWNGKFYE